MPIYIDLTNLMNISFLTGIQRVTNEIVLRLLENKSNVVLIMYDNDKELFIRLDNEKFINYYKYNIGSKSQIITRTSLNISDINKGSIFFDIDSVWNNKLKRSYLYPILRKQEVTIVVHVYDIIPVLYPQYCHKDTIFRFLDYLGATIQYANEIITNTKSTHEDLLSIAKRIGIDCPKTNVVYLGCDFQKSDLVGEVDPNIIEIVQKGKYILQVGTIEPRKNHKLVIDALEQGLNDLDLNIIFVGRLGWNVDELKQRINDSEFLNKKLFHLDNCNDKTVDYLYKNAFLTIFPTYYEGFGLPIIESMEHGVPVICSKCKVLEEVGGEFCDYVDQENPQELIDCVKKYKNDSNAYKLKKEQIKNFKYFKWDQSALEMLNILEKLMIKKKYSVIYPKQMVILSAQVEVLLDTIEFIEKFMNFIKEIVILAPNRIKSKIISKYSGHLSLKILTDEEILNKRKIPRDHQERNTLLRYEAIKRSEIDDVFIMSDDDYRPLMNIDISVFVKYGRYNAYYSYDLEKWSGTLATEELTSYDKGMFNTYNYLKENKLPTKQYSAHMPQIIDKRILLELLDEHLEIENRCVDEWSMYFNYSINKYPELFEPQVYKTLCWPALPSDWELQYYPKEYLFENFYPVLYEKDNIFSEFSDKLNNNIEMENMKKIKVRDDLYLDYKSHIEAVHAMKVLYEISTNKEYKFLINYTKGKIYAESPNYIIASKDALIKLKLDIENDSNIELDIYYNFVVGVSTSIMKGQTMKFKLGPNSNNFSTIIPIWTPKKEGRYNLHIYYLVKDRDTERKINTSMDAIIYSID